MSIFRIRDKKIIISIVTKCSKKVRYVPLTKAFPGFHFIRGRLIFLGIFFRGGDRTEIFNHEQNPANSA